MNALIRTIFSWILHNFMTLLVIIVVLLLVQVGRVKWQEYLNVKGDIKVVSDVVMISDNVENMLVGNYTRQTKEFDSSFAELPKKKRDAALKELKTRIGKFDQLREKLLKERSVPLVDLLKKRLSFDMLKNAMQREVEIELLTQSLSYLRSLKSRLEPEDKIRESLEWLNIHEKTLKTEGIKVAAKISNLKKKNPVLIHIPGADPYEIYQNLQNELKDIQKIFQDVVERKEKGEEQLRRLPPLVEFNVDRKAVEETIKPLQDRAKVLRDILAGSWFERIRKPAMELLPSALMILLGIILTPILIKGLFYFVLAPLATLRPPLRLLPRTSGDLRLETGNHAVSRPVVVDSEHELLVHSDFLQSSSVRGCKDTTWFLNKKIPLTSLASGMVALTRIRTDAPETFVISATKDSFSEIGILSIPQGAALVMQPHNLVGIVQLKSSPVHITSHWRLNSLHAWLTLQLRYLAFHGPTQLIVQGCRGIRIEQADGGRSINQAATIGFSANLAYSTRRCETFFAYLLGKRELLNDNFSGEKGFYVYQEMPYLGKKRGFPKRGLEGLTDSLLKVFGI